MVSNCDGVPLPNQFGHGFVIADEILRSAGKVGVLSCRDVNPELLVKGGEDFLKVHRSSERLFAQTSGRSDHLTGVHAAASEQSGQAAGGATGSNDRGPNRVGDGGGARARGRCEAASC